MNGIWSPLCGHYFWDTEFGANFFCQKLTSNSASTGKIIKRPEPLERDGIRVGTCLSTDQWLSCTGGCNDLGIGKGCAQCQAGSPYTGSIEIKCTQGKENI